MQWRFEEASVSVTSWDRNGEALEACEQRAQLETEARENEALSLLKGILEMYRFLPGFCHRKSCFLWENMCICGLLRFVFLFPLAPQRIPNKWTRIKSRFIWPRQIAMAERGIFSAFLLLENYTILCFHFVICFLYRRYRFLFICFWRSSLYYMYYSLPLYFCGHRKFCPHIYNIIGFVIIYYLLLFVFFLIFFICQKTQNYMSLLGWFNNLYSWIWWGVCSFSCHCCCFLIFLWFTFAFFFF